MSDTITVNTSTTNITLSVFSQPNNINVKVVEAGAVWGSINGTITNQADLINYIGKLGVTSPYGQAASNTSIYPLIDTNIIANTGNYSSIVGGQSNYTSLSNTFILGSNLSASQSDYTYVNNLSTLGSIYAGLFYGDGSNLTGVILPGQADINSLVQNTSGNWNTAYNIATSYSSVSSSFVTNTTVKVLTGLLTPLTTTNILTGLLTLTTTTNTLTGLLVKITDLNTLSATLLTRTDANTLTSLLVTNTVFSSYQTNVANTTATLLPTSVYQSASGSFATNNLLTNYLPLSGGTLTGKLTASYIAVSSLNITSTPVTFNNPVTASGTFVIINVNGSNQALQLWNYTS
jgi:hypothetical protein